MSMDIRLAALEQDVQYNRKECDVNIKEVLKEVKAADCEFRKEMKEMSAKVTDLHIKIFTNQN